MKDFSERFQVGDKVVVEDYYGDDVFRILGFDILNECYIAQNTSDLTDENGFYGPGIYRLDNYFGVALETPIKMATLALTPEEAYALTTLCARIGGDPETTPRGLINSVRVKLEAEGFYRDHSPYEFTNYLQGVRYAK